MTRAVETMSAREPGRSNPRLVDFQIEPTLRDFWRSKAFYQFIIGPLGSSKTTNCIMKLMAYARLQRPGRDGTRRTRFAIARPTLQQIKTTVLTDILTWFRPMLRYKVSDSKIEIRVGDVESDWYLIPLENIEDQRRLLSMQLSGVYLNEFREIPLELMTAAAGRVDRFPRKLDGGCTNPFVMGDSNPPPLSGEWHNFLVSDKPDDCLFVHQPSGLDPRATWRRYLPDGYYERLVQGHDKDWVSTHVRSMWSPDLSGEAVFRNSFNPEFHIRQSLQGSPGLALLLGADWGRTPAVLFAQLDARGRLCILKELLAENMNVELFYSTIVQPCMLNEFTGYRHFLIGDPIGTAKSDRSEESIFDVLSRLGFNAIPAPTNDIAPRLRAVESRLLQAPGGEPGLLIDPVGCPMLVRALGHEYKYPRRKTGTVDDKPDKSHPWSDLADSLQYLCLGVETNAVERATRREWRRMQRGARALSMGAPGGAGGGSVITPEAWT